MGAFIVTQFPGHEDCTAGAQCCRVSLDSLSFILLTREPKLIFAFWQQGCSSRPAQEMASPAKWLSWCGWCRGGCGQSREKVQGRCGQKSPYVVHLPKLTAQLQKQGESPSGLPKSPLVSLVSRITRGTSSAQAAQDCPGLH